MKKLTICACLLCTMAFINSSLANSTDDISQKTILKQKQNELAKLNIKNDNQVTEYLNLESEIADINMYINENKATLKLLNKILNQTQELYGEKSIETIPVYIKLFDFYWKTNNSLAQKTYLDKALEIITLNPGNKNLEKEVYSRKAHFYHHYENPYKSLKTLETVKNYVDNNNFNDKYYYLGQIAASNQATRNFKATDKAYKDLYNYLINSKKATKDDYFDYYCMLILYYIDSSQYNKVPKLYNTIMKYAKGNDDNSISKRIEINSIFISYYKELHELKKAKELLDESSKLVSAIQDSHIKKESQIQLNNDFIHYYNEKNEHIKSKSYLNEIYEYYKKQCSGIDTKWKKDKYDSYIDLYNNLNNADKALEIAKKLENILEDEKETAPVIYGNLLIKISEINNKENTISKRIQYAISAKTQYEKALPKNSFKLYEINKSLGDLYNENGNPNKALESLKLAEKILLPLEGENNKEAIEINTSYAETYCNMGDLNSAIIRINKAINTAKKIYGTENIKVYKLIYEKSNIYKHFNQTKNAQIYYNQVAKVIEANKLTSEDNSLNYDYYSNLAKKNIEEGNYNKALEYTAIAEQYAKRSLEKSDLNYILSDIHKRLNNPIESAKYKLRAKKA